MVKDLLGRPLAVGHLVAWGHSGRYAGTRIGRIYRIEDTVVHAWIVERARDPQTWRHTGPWQKSHHAKPLNVVKLDDLGSDVPTLDELLGAKT